MKTRMIVNLVAFCLITLGLVGYGVFDLLGNPLQTKRLVSATFPDAAGLAPNFGVVLDGVVVGSVDSVQLTRQGAEVEIALRPGIEVPSNVVASIGLANDLGEQQIQLRPRGTPSTTPLRAGARIPVEHGGIPVQVGRVIGTASRLLKSIGARQLNTVLATLGQGLSGQAQNLQTIMTASQQFSSEFLAYQHQFEALLANSTPVLNGLAGAGAQLRQDLANTEVLANVLDHHRYDLVHLLGNGAVMAQLANRFLVANEPNLACILHDFAAVSANGAQPANLSNLSVGLATNTWFFGAVAGISPTGPAKSLFPGDPANPNQVWLRTRLLIPPGSPGAQQYGRPTSLNTVMPGAACATQFGRGVGPASQSLAQYPVTGTRYDWPSSSSAYVSGGSTGSTGSGAPSGASGTSGASGASTTSSVSSLPSASGRRPGGRMTTSRVGISLAGDPVPVTRQGGGLAWLLLLLLAPVGLVVLVPRRRRYARATVPVERAPARRPRQSLSSPDRKDRP